jgi:hypothetical protein
MARSTGKPITRPTLLDVIALQKPDGFTDDVGGTFVA